VDLNYFESAMFLLKEVPDHKLGNALSQMKEGMELVNERLSTLSMKL
jgi:hypothetical protein